MDASPVLMVAYSIDLAAQIALQTAAPAGRVAMAYQHDITVNA
jgi:hypothetical protein